MASTVNSKRLCLLVCLFSTAAWGGDWKFTPSVTLSERFSDNVTLESGDQKQSDWITEISPGFSLDRNGARVKVNVNYSLHGLLYADDSDRNDVRHTLNGRANAELVQDFFFLESTARISDQLLNQSDAGGLGDAVGIGNTTSVGSYTLSPYVKHRFGSTATLEARLTHEGVFIGESALSDSEKTRYRLNLASGNAMHPLSWGASYDKSEANGGGVADNDSERMSANARYLLNRQFGLLAQANYEKNDFVGASNRLQDYSSYGLGVFYAPSRKISMDVFYNYSDNGNFVSGSLTLNPTLRTTINATTSERAYGRTNSLNLSHRTRKTKWSLRYTDDLTTSQQQFTNFSGYLCPIGTLPPDPSCTPVFNQVQSNEVYLAKNLIGAVNYTLRRNTWNLSLYNNQREFQTSGTTDTTRGLRGTWSLRPAAHTTFSLTGGVSRAEVSSDDRKDDLWDLSLVASHQFQPKLTGNVEVRHQERNSSLTGDGYAENSVVARVNMRF